MSDKGNDFSGFLIRLTAELELLKQDALVQRIKRTQTGAYTTSTELIIDYLTLFDDIKKLNIVRQDIKQEMDDQYSYLFKLSGLKRYK